MQVAGETNQKASKGKIKEEKTEIFLTNENDKRH